VSVSSDESALAHQRQVRPFNFEPGHWKKQLPKKYLDLAERGDLPRLAEVLREHPEYLSKRGSHNRTLLWVATRSGKMELVRWLIESGADVNATGCYNGETFVQVTPFCAARYYRREAIAAYLWEHGSALDVFRAAFLGDRVRVEQELAAQPDLLHAEDPHDDIYYVPLLSFAVAGGQTDLARDLIRRGANVTTYSGQLIGLAAKQSRKDLVDLVLANGADVRAVGAATFVAVSDLGLLTYLLSRGVSPHGSPGNSWPPLAYVARGDKGEHPEKIRLLLDHGADVNVVAPGGKTALHYAATAGHIRVVQLLFDRGANPALLDADGHTAYDLAQAAGKSDCAELLARA
jgi:ankyrin repeat protein